MINRSSGRVNCGRCFDCWLPAESWRVLMFVPAKMEPDVLGKFYSQYAEGWNQCIDDMSKGE